MNRDWSVTLSKSNVVQLRAKQSTRCPCGSIVVIGSLFLWDKEMRRTVGCTACHGEHPDPHCEIDEWADDYPIFHE